MELKYTSIDNVIKNMYIAPEGSDKLFEVVINRVKKVEGSGKRGIDRVKNREIRRIRVATRYIVKILRKIALSSPFIDELHPFYRELFSIVIDSLEYRKCLSFIYRSSRLVENISRKYIREIIFSHEINDILRIRKSFFGRLKSILDELDTCLRKVKRYQFEILKLPSLNPESFSVIIAGAPNVGKSSILKILTNAKPEIKPYPFTTKEIIVGHIELGEKRIQVIDTPGLLDRPLEDKNLIEKKAILALKHFRGILLFIFDPTETCGFTSEYQCSILRELIVMFPYFDKIIVLNKADLFNVDHMKRLFSLCDIINKFDVIKISALKGTNIDELKRSIYERIR